MNNIDNYVLKAINLAKLYKKKKDVKYINKALKVIDKAIKEE